MTNDQKNKELCRLLGICWHEPRTYLEGTQAIIRCRLCGSGNYTNPNFAIDPVLLLGEMEKRDDWGIFQTKYFWYDRSAFYERTYAIPVKLILDQTGKLLDLAMEWMRREKG